MKKKDNEAEGNLPDARDVADVLNILYLPEHVEEKKTESWLKSTLVKEVDSLLCQYRSLYAELFLQSILYPFVDDGSTIDEETLVNLLVDYKKSLSGFEPDFELSNVLANILNHFQCYSADEVSMQLVYSEALNRDLRLFTMLSELDQKAVNQMVLKLIKTG
jgi:hypothetical protein